MKNLRPSFSLFPVQYTQEIWIPTTAITLAFIALEFFGHALHTDPHTLDHFANSLLDRTLALPIWDLINRVGYLFYFAPFILPSLRLEKGVLRRILTGFSIQIAIGILLILSVSADVFSADILPCLHVANVLFVTLTLFRLRKALWIVIGPLVATGIIFSAILTRRHDWTEIALALVLGYGAYRAAFSRSLGFLEQLNPSYGVQRHLRNFWNLLVHNSASNWEETYRTGQWEFLTTPDQRPRHYVIAGFIRDHFPQGAAILDVGCGYGDLFALSNQLKDKYHGIDLSETVIQKCRERFSAAEGVLFRSTAFEQFVSDGKYDVIVLNEVLYYFPVKEIKQVLSHAEQLLRDENSLLIISMNSNWKATFMWWLLARQCIPYQSIRTVNSETGSYWNVRAYHLRRRSSAVSAYHPTLRDRLALWASDLNNRINMEALFLRRRDPWKYGVSVYEKNRLDAMWHPLQNTRFRQTLEIGTGEGHFSVRLASISDRLTCLDLSRVALARTKQRIEMTPGYSGNVDFIQGNMRGWHAKAETYDLLVLGDVLYYLEAPRKIGRWVGAAVTEQLPRAIAQMTSWVKPGGSILLCHGYGLPHELDRLYRYRDLFRQYGATLVNEHISEPADKGQTRFILTRLKKEL